MVSLVLSLWTLLALHVELMPIIHMRQEYHTRWLVYRFTAVLPVSNEGLVVLEHPAIVAVVRFLHER